MKHVLLHCVLLAQQSPLDNFAREFQGRQTRINSGYLTTGLVILVGMVLAVWLLSLVLDRYGGRGPADNSLALFLALCRAHQLRWSEWWLLWRVARDHALSDPARLFLEPERLDSANLGPILRLRSEQLKAIRERLFAGATADGSPSAPPADRRVEGGTPPPWTENRGWSPLPGVPGAASNAPAWPPSTAPDDRPPPTPSPQG